MKKSRNKEEQATEKEEEDKTEVGLTVSSQLPLEAIAMGTGAVYTCQKSFRAEKSDTNKHLAEFLHVEYEEYFITLDDLLNQAEAYVKHVMRTVRGALPGAVPVSGRRHHGAAGIPRAPRLPAEPVGQTLCAHHPRRGD